MPNLKYHLDSIIVWPIGHLWSHIGPSGPGPIEALLFYVLHLTFTWIWIYLGSRCQSAALPTCHYHSLLLKNFCASMCNRAGSCCLSFWLFLEGFWCFFVFGLVWCVVCVCVWAFFHKRACWHFYWVNQPKKNGLICFKLCLGRERRGWGACECSACGDEKRTPSPLSLKLRSRLTELYSVSAENQN